VGMPFIELAFADKFILRFLRNDDGTYGRPYTLDEIIQLQDMADSAFGLTRDNPYKEKKNADTKEN